MSVAEGAVLRVVATFDIGGASKAQNVYHLINETSGGADDNDVVNSCGEWVENAMDTLVGPTSDDVSLDLVEVYERVAGEWEPVGSVTSTWVGTNATDRVPSGVALLVEFYKPRTGHADRKFLAGMVESNIAGDAWSAPLMTNGAAYVTEVISPFTSTSAVDLKACYFNRELETTVFYNGGAPIQKVSYQRRRRPGAGLS